MFKTDSYPKMLLKNFVSSQNWTIIYHKMNYRGKGAVDSQGLFGDLGPLAPSPLYPLAKFAGCKMVKFCELAKFL